MSLCPSYAQCKNTVFYCGIQCFTGVYSVLLGRIYCDDTNSIRSIPGQNSVYLSDHPWVQQELFSVKASDCYIMWAVLPSCSRSTRPCSCRSAVWDVNPSVESFHGCSLTLSRISCAMVPMSDINPLFVLPFNRNRQNYPGLSTSGGAERTHGGWVCHLSPLTQQNTWRGQSSILPVKFSTTPLSLNRYQIWLVTDKISYRKWQWMFVLWMSFTCLSYSCSHSQTAHTGVDSILGMRPYPSHAHSLWSKWDSNLVCYRLHRQH